MRFSKQVLEELWHFSLESRRCFRVREKCGGGRAGKGIAGSCRPHVPQKVLCQQKETERLREVGLSGGSQTQRVGKFGGLCIRFDPRSSSRVDGKSSFRALFCYSRSLCWHLVCVIFDCLLALIPEATKTFKVLRPNKLNRNQATSKTVCLP